METHPLSELVATWSAKIEQGLAVKEDRFQQYADECMRFYDGAHNFMWEEDYASGGGGFLDEDSWQAGGLPHFRMTVNRIFEAVALFGPALFARYPQVTVTPVNPPQVSPDVIGLDMQDQQHVQAYQMYLQEEQAKASVRANCASLKEHYLNWAQVETDKKLNCRRALTEAIVKGMGCVYHELYRPDGSSIAYPRSTYLSVDDYVKDPDASYHENVEWVAVRRVQPVNRVEKKFGLEPGTIKGHLQSFEMQATKKGKREARNRTYNTDAQSYDLLEYWEVFSKNGMGDKLTTESVKKKDMDLSFFGPYCYLAIARGVPFPLNLPNEAFEEDEEAIFMRGQWPVPFWTDAGLGNGWPVSEVSFFHKPGCVWPVSLFKPVIGEMRFINWCMSFLADRVAASSTTYVGVMKSAKAELKDQLTGGMAPFTMVEVSEVMGKSVKDLISFLDSPSVNTDIWTMVAAVMDRIDKATGLTELMYGMSSRQIRSAREADIKDANTSIRPDDMAEQTENWISQTIMKEMETIAWLGTEQDLAPVLGEIGAKVFIEQFNKNGFEYLVRDFSYRIEAGSARKPNKAARFQSLSQFGQIALPVIQQFALQGMFDPWNAYVSEYAKALDMDAAPFLMRRPEPDPQQQAVQQAQQQMQMQAQQLDLQDKQLGVVEKQVDIQDKNMETSERQAGMQVSLMNALMQGEATMADIELKRAQREALKVE